MNVKETTAKILGFDNGLSVQIVDVGEIYEQATVWRGPSNITSEFGNDSDFIPFKSIEQVSTLLMRVKNSTEVIVAGHIDKHLQVASNIIQDFISDISDRRGIKNAWSDLSDEEKYNIILEFNELISNELQQGEDPEFTSSKIQHLLKKRMLEIPEFLEEWVEIEADTLEDIHSTWLDLIEEHVSSLN